MVVSLQAIFYGIDAMFPCVWEQDSKAIGHPYAKLGRKGKWMEDRSLAGMHQSDVGKICAFELEFSPLHV